MNAYMATRAIFRDLLPSPYEANPDFSKPERFIWQEHFPVPQKTITLHPFGALREAKDSPSMQSSVHNVINRL